MTWQFWRLAFVHSIYSIITYLQQIVQIKIISRAILQKTRAIHAHIMVLLSSLQVHTSSPQNFLSSAMHTLATATQPRLPWKFHIPETIHSLISKEMLMYMYPSLHRYTLVPKIYLQRTYFYKVNHFLSGQSDQLQPLSTENTCTLLGTSEPLNCLCERKWQTQCHSFQPYHLKLLY